MYKQTLEEKILQRRRQILVHSYLYYVKDTNIVSDSKWTQWAQELVVLQNENWEICESLPYHEQFIDFDGSSGFDFKYDKNIIRTAHFLLKKA